MRLYPAAVCLAALTFVGNPGALSAQSATVNGVVVNGVTQTGIGGVSVRMFTSGGVFHVVETDPAGRFSIAGAANGTYRFTVEKEGFDPNFGSDEPTARITGPQTDPVTLQMLPWTTLRGRVVDTDGEPVEGATVEVQRTGEGGMRRQAESDANGGFEIDRLLPGGYLLVARPAPIPAGEASPDTSSETRLAPVATYYPSAVEPLQAQAVRLTGLGEEARYEIRLRSLPVYRVSGKVTDESGDPVAGTTVQLTRPEDSSHFPTRIADMELFVPVTMSGPEGEPVVTADDGTFEMPAVTEGSWTVQAASGWEFDETIGADRQEIGRVEVSIVRGDVEDLEIRVHPNFSFTGEAVFSGDLEASRNLHGSLLLSSVDGGEPVMGTMTPLHSGQPATGVKGQDGAEVVAPLYFERAFPGRYRVLPMLSVLPGFYAARVELGGRDVLGQVIDLAPFAPPLRVIYEQGAGTIREAWRNSSEAAAASLVLVPAENLAGEYVRSQPCSSTPCEFTNLRPGSYMVGAFDRVDRTVLADPLAATGLTRYLTRVTVRESATETVELGINRWPQ